MSLHQVNSAFNLLGQTQEPAESVHLPGPASPTLNVSWGAFHQGFASNLGAILSGPSYARNYVYTGVFKDLWIEGRIPRIALLVALVLHVAIVLVPFPRALTAVRHNPWRRSITRNPTGPVPSTICPVFSSLHAKPAPHSKAALETPSTTPEPPAFASIFTDSAHPTHPRQSAGPAKPRAQIDQQALAKLHPRERRAATSTVAPPTDAPVFQQQQADLTIQATPTGPAHPKLALNAGAAPRLAERTQSGDPAAAPELADTRSATAGGNPSTLIALSSAPAPPAAEHSRSARQFAARAAISPKASPEPPVAHRRILSQEKSQALPPPAASAR